MTTNFNSLTACLKSYGIDKNFLRRIVLPDWWNEDILTSKAGYMQTLSIIAKNLNLNFADLLENSDKFSQLNQYPIKFKKSANVNISEKDLWPNVIASRISKLIEETFSLAEQIPDSNVFNLRNNFLSNYDKIELSTVLDFLWESGIPVIYISEFPRDVHKMDGMVVKNGSRYIMFISKNREHNAWALFVILHELGHILNNHIRDDEPVIYDIDIEAETDEEEHQANNSALSFLSGSENHKMAEGNFKTGFQLATYCLRTSATYKVDPGVIALNYAYNYNNYPLAQLALKILDPKADAISAIISKMEHFLHLDNLSEENLEFFKKVTAVEGG